MGILRLSTQKQSKLPLLQLVNMLQSSPVGNTPGLSLCGSSALKPLLKFQQEKETCPVEMCYPLYLEVDPYIHNTHSPPPFLMQWDRNRTHNKADKFLHRIRNN